MAERNLLTHRAGRKMGRRPWLSVAAAVIAIGAFGVAIWYAYGTGMRADGNTEVPLIAAEPGPFKVRPQDPGGMEVPNRDKLVYEALTSGRPAQRVEQLLPPPEQPLPKPPPPPAAEAPAAQPPLPDLDTAAPAPDSDTTAPPAESSEQPQTAALAPEPKAEPRPAAPGYRIQVASVRSEAQARDDWRRLARSYPDLLGNLELRVERVDLGPGKGIYHRVQAGPLSEKALAEMLCGKLKARNVDCLVVNP